METKRDIRQRHSEADAAPSNRTPVGYCPHCDYALMDAGVCPECGENVDARRLAATPCSQTRRRRIRRAALLLVVGGLIVGGLSFYRSRIWQGWIPTSYLLARQPANDWTQVELINRLNAGSLSPAEIVRLIDALTWLELSFRSPSPRSTTPARQITIHDTYCQDRAIPQVTRAVNVDQLLVNGKPIGIPFTDNFAGPIWQGGSIGSAGSIAELAGLPPGKYEITMTGETTYDVRPAMNSPSIPGFPVTKPIALTSQLEIVDQPNNEFVQLRYDTKLADEVAAETRIAVRWEPRKRHFVLRIASDGPPIDVVGRFRFLDAANNQVLGERHFSIDKANPTNTANFAPLTQAMPDNGFKLIVEFVPDPETAYSYFHSEIFGGRMIWNDPGPIVASPDENASISNPTISASQCKPPDVVEPWAPDAANPGESKQAAP